MRLHFLAIIVLPIFLAACGKNVQGSGKISTRDYALDGFTGISISDRFMVTVTGTDAFKVSLTTDDNILDVLSVIKDSNMLQIEMDKRKARSFKATRLELAVSMPELRTVSLGYGSKLTLAQPYPKGTHISLLMNAGSQADLGGMTMQKANVILKDGAKAVISVTDSLDYQLSAGAQLRYQGSPAIGLKEMRTGAMVVKY
jgi:hypothetical protein